MASEDDLLTDVEAEAWVGSETATDDIGEGDLIGVEASAKGAENEQISGKI